MVWRIRTGDLQDSTYTWDETGNLTARDNLLEEETENFSYDYLDRLVGGSSNSSTNPYTESYSYDAIGNITAKNGVSYTYGAKPHAVTQVGSTGYEYDANGNLTQRGDQTLGWDAENRLISISGTPAEQTSFKDADHDSEIGGTTWIAEGFIPEVSHTVTLLKLKLGRSTAAPQGNVNVSLRNTDVNGLPTGSDLATASLAFSELDTEDYVLYTFTLSEGVELTQGETYAIVINAPEMGTSDLYFPWGEGDEEVGRIFSGGSGAYWNEPLYGEVVYFEEWGTVLDTDISFIYDGDGKRVLKTENGESTLYINQYYELDPDQEIVTTYYYLGGKLIARMKGSELSYIQQDHLGSTAAVSDEYGDAVATINYFSFGETRSTTGTLAMDKLFTGQRLDSTGLYYYGARYYDPQIGRFISPDIYVKEYASPQSLNRYTYVLNNPFKYTDPTGWDTEGTGGYFNLGFGIGISVDVLRVTDTQGNKGWTLTVSFLGTTPNAGAGYQYQKTNADSINNLKGLSGGAGGSTGKIPWYIPSGGEYIGYHRSQEGGWEGYNVTGGYQGIPIEIHGTIGYTWLFGFISTSNINPQLPVSKSAVSNRVTCTGKPFSIYGDVNSIE